MNRREFEELFRQKLNEAAKLAETSLNKNFSREFGILRNSPRADGRRISVEEAVTELYISESRFFLIIDIAVVEVSPAITWFWTQESGHPPSSFDQTWNQPQGSGPFKIMFADNIRGAQSLG
jgi:hypothetical protein